ncbi:MAG: putative pyrophosphatase MazG [Candidatus Methanohalarchaeum thermophilum]|uniref:Pyrophosphatase MazG n=1 Tax=Methanohalarchaeum thermophilum TaxID=1903181 RepID=A0A1Q6DWE8_METT1|nr:MAG: putative pyrophosphatase MazG [Candidatus Methanohalarchaeum thermophilum]
MNSLEDLQEEVDSFINNYEEGYWPPLSMLAALVEEVGELSRELNDEFGSKPKKDLKEKGDIRNELGDTLFSLICIANYLDIDLESALESTMEKYRDRDSDRWTEIK